MGLGDTAPGFRTLNYSNLSWRRYMLQLTHFTWEERRTGRLDICSVCFVKGEHWAELPGISHWLGRQLSLASSEHRPHCVALSTPSQT